MLLEAKAKIFLHKGTNWTKWQKTVQTLTSGFQLGRRNGPAEEGRELAARAEHEPWEGRAVKEKFGAVQKSVSIPEGSIRQ